MSLPFDNEISYLFASFLRHVSENATSYWFLLQENDAPSKATTAVRHLWSEEEKTKHNNIEMMNQSSLQQYGGLDRDHYIAMLLKLKLVRTRKRGIIANPDVWTSFFIFHKIDAEMDKRRPFGTPSARYMRIGRKEDQYHTKVATQGKRCEFAPPPRCSGIDDARRDLRDGLRRLLTKDDLDKRKAVSTAAAAAAANGKKKSSQNNSTEATNASGNNNVDEDNGEDVPAKKPPKYPIMDMLKINPDDFSSDRGANNLKRLIGELITLQQVQSGNKTSVEFYKLCQSKPASAVIISSHKSHEAFDRYHRRSPYIEEVIRCMDSDEDVAIKRLSSYLKKKKRKRNSINAGNETSPKRTSLNSDTEVVGQKKSA